MSYRNALPIQKPIANAVLVVLVAERSRYGLRLFLALAAMLLVSMSSALASSTGPRASVMLSNAAAVISQTSDTEWKLEKTGGVNGSTVRQFLNLTNTALGGSTTGFSVNDLDSLTDELNLSFAGGGVSTFAQEHLVNGTCP
jgi:hypothetical protein